MAGATGALTASARHVVGAADLVSQGDDGPILDKVEVPLPQTNRCLAGKGQRRPIRRAKVAYVHVPAVDHDLSVVARNVVLRADDANEVGTLIAVGWGFRRSTQHDSAVESDHIAGYEAEDPNGWTWNLDGLLRRQCLAAQA